MNIEEFRNKYKFAKNMDLNDMKHLLMFFMSAMLSITIDDKSLMEDFFGDVKKVIHEKDN